MASEKKLLTKTDAVFVIPFSIYREADFGRIFSLWAFLGYQCQQPRVCAERRGLAVEFLRCRGSHS